MSGCKEYWMHLHVGGKFVRDPYVRYVGGTLVEGATEGVGVGVEDVGVEAKGSPEDADVEVEGAPEGVIDGDIVDATVVDVFDGDGETANESEVEGAYGSEDDDVYSIKIRYLSDGEGDEELQSIRDNFKIAKGKDGSKIKNHREENEVESDNANSMRKMKMMLRWRGS
ncbi:hypothetical protein V6N13_064116 [Hibiscus sabdariffa]|uniref:Uncharacterized protein n=2 Tax=Hibiscus sabdariffa TaxID=183260 RepID=A0ABR2ACL5_9ROSI